ncbi:MAG: hypothetical protein K5898_04860 [Ruminococcus sp.]|uniref:hypothetical protein n=1 Tax=Ruminococcus sp. TaxID=41978 RepID=UPI0025D4EAF9|nr:hypothetical protein [Ruminococcus sp.]MCR4794487.1 hypothetical protein [Ruminococcus sp.]
MNTFLFVLMFAVSVAVTAVFLNEAKCDINGNSKISKKTKSLLGTARCIAVLLIFIAAAEAFGIIKIREYKGAFLMLGGAAGLSMLICTLNKKRRYHTAVTAVKALLIAVVLEATIFNIPTFRLWFGSYGEMSFSAQELSVNSNVDYRPAEDDIAVIGDRSTTFTFKGINEEVADVFVDIDFGKNTKAANVSIDAMDETRTTDYRQMIAEGTLVKGKPHSHYIQLHLSGDVSNLKLTVSPLDEGMVYIKGITFNQQIPMSISWARIFLIVFAACFWQLMMKSKTMQYSFTKNKKIFRLACVIITDIACLAAVLITFTKLDNTSITDIMKRPSGNQMTQELVEAFEHGSTRLLTEPVDELNNFPTPYNSDALDEAHIRYQWDHVYFNEHYYSYYGIAPVILVFLPYHLLTGYFFPDSIAVLLFAIIGMIGLTRLYKEFLKRFFPKTPTGIAIAGLILIQTVSGVWFSIGRPLFYEVAMSAGFATLTWAVYFLFSANIIGTEKPILSRTAIASLLFAIAVLCRPTLVLYCITAALFMVLALPRMSAAKKKSEKKLFTPSEVRYLLCAIVPMACIGLAQMWYNYDRFGSPFEFGIQYSLTINDFTKTQFHPRLSWTALYNYFLNPPVFKTYYPIIGTEFQFMNAGGYFYADLNSTANTSGLFFLALPMFVYLLSGRAVKMVHGGRRAKLLSAAYIAIPCLFIPFGIVASVWESGYAVRYMVDFAWQSLLGAYTIIFFFYSRITDPTKKKLISAFMWFSVMWGLVVAGVQEFNQAFRFDIYNREFPEMAYEVQRMFAFWV